MSPTRRNPHKSRTLRRRVGVRTPRRTLLVFCEGEKTEPDYLRALKHEPAIREAASVEIRINKDTFGSVPLTLVKTAAAARTRATGEEGEVDEVWCLFDVEAPKKHPNLAEAKALAKRSNVHIAISNPCFELWLALHFQDQTAWLDNDDAVRLRRRHDGSKDKRVDAATYMPLREDASRRARLLTGKHARDLTPFPHDNPSSGMYRFLDAIERGS